MASPGMCFGRTGRYGGWGIRRGRRNGRGEGGLVLAVWVVGDAARCFVACCWHPLWRLRGAGVAPVRGGSHFLCPPRGLPSGRQRKESGLTPLILDSYPRSQFRQLASCGLKSMAQVAFAPIAAKHQLPVMGNL